MRQADFLRIQATRSEISSIWAHLGGTEPTDTGLKELRKLKNLRKLTLFGAKQISDAGVKGLQHSLTNLSIER